MPCGKKNVLFLPSNQFINKFKASIAAFFLMKSYKHLFFDLDKTLWDFEKNAEATFRMLFSEYKITEKCNCTFLDFYKTYQKHNEQLWDAYRKGDISKEFLHINRFSNTLKHFNIQDPVLAIEMADKYITETPNQTNLYPNCIETLELLNKKGFQLYILTNGFVEVQYRKIEKSGIYPYFTKIFTSEELGFQKPNKEIFRKALQKANANTEDSIMIGDDLEVDILGAREAGIDQIYVNYNRTPHNQSITHEINDLKEILTIVC
jgi:putative hydrolase of the HAD superfamily